MAKKSCKQAMAEVDKLIEKSNGIPLGFLSGDPKKTAAETKLYEAANKAKKGGLKQ